MFQSAIAILLVWAVSSVSAQQTKPYPARPIKIIVPTVAGGGVDALARQMAQKMGEKLGQSVVIENRAGAAGIIGIDVVAKSSGDGYTLLFSAASIALNSALGMKLPYDPELDFTPISLVASVPVLIAAHPSTPYRTIDDIVDAGKKTPGGVSYAVASVGAVTHLMGEALKFQTGSNLVMVPYKGAGQAVQDVVAGQVPVIFDAIFPSGTFVAAGKLRGIAVASNKRSPLFPDIPTVVEQGYPELIGSGFYGLLAPANTPSTIVAKINEAVRAALAEPETREKLLKQGFEIHESSPQEYRTFLREQIARWAPIVKKSGIKVE